MSEQSIHLYLVLIETSGNQAFIFSTNKLRENVGASEATYRACSQWVLEAATGITEHSLWSDDSEVLNSNILNSQINPAIEDSESNLVEVIIAASGKAVLITRKLEHAQQIIEKVTLRALIEAPGLDVCGAIEAFEWNGEIKLSEVSRRLHQKFEVVRSLRPSPETRFLRLPIVEDCRTSGLPAARIELDLDERFVPRSATSLGKREWSRKALDERLPKLLKDTTFKFAKSADKTLDEDSESSWLAVIHADGNGLGQIFINLEEHIEVEQQIKGDRHDNRNYIQQFREFSLALDVCTRQAFIIALSVFPPEKRQPLRLVPLVLGGDDLTVICDAQYALAFTRSFLQAFEQATQASAVISKIAAKAFGISSGKLSACAGIAIVKPHFPFSTAYQLAEELARSAKVVKEIVKRNEQTVPCSAIDFHILYDTRGTRLEAIREKLTFQAEKTYLYNRPYVVSAVEDIMQMVEQREDLEKWLDEHHWSKLEKRVKALRKTDEDTRRVLPNSQMHTLREGLFTGKNGADAQYSLIHKRYEQQGINEIAATDNPDSLFWQDSMTEYSVTGFLDAMDAADFWIVNQPTTATEEIVG
jgi:hypothetical protein